MPRVEPQTQPQLLHGKALVKVTTDFYFAIFVGLVSVLGHKTLSSIQRFVTLLFLILSVLNIFSLKLLHTTPLAFYCFSYFSDGGPSFLSRVRLRL